uniref:Uncharacterized protein n=1 Tax=Anguilla anguilla TaxID=7936 RepID=A0A0E9T9S6_ANGAN
MSCFSYVITLKLIFQSSKHAYVFEHVPFRGTNDS